MSWCCAGCGRVFPDTRPAYGWECAVYCRDCWEVFSGKAFGEPPMPGRKSMEQSERPSRVTCADCGMSEPRDSHSSMILVEKSDPWLWRCRTCDKKARPDAWAPPTGWLLLNTPITLTKAEVEGLDRQGVRRLISKKLQPYGDGMLQIWEWFERA